MLNQDIKLLSKRNISVNIECRNSAIELDSNQFLNDLVNGLVQGISQLPIHPGFEKHPYKGILINDYAEKYIIGTFPPLNYLIDIIRTKGVTINCLKQPTSPNQSIREPKIPFFHGNVSALWSALLSIDELSELSSFLPERRNDAKQFLIKKLYDLGIYYDDIIISTQRKLGKLPGPHNNIGYTYEDVNLKNICPDFILLQKIMENNNLQVVCFTNGATFRSGDNGGLQFHSQKKRTGLIKTGKSDALSLFMRTCQEVGFLIEMRCLPHFDWTYISHLTDVQKRTKLIFEFRLTNTKNVRLYGIPSYERKTFTVLTPFSPAAHGNIEWHPIVVAMKNTFGKNLAASQLLPIIYYKFRSNNYKDLYDYNINE
jgi:hypothetical protein